MVGVANTVEVMAEDGEVVRKGERRRLGGSYLNVELALNWWETEQS